MSQVYQASTPGNTPSNYKYRIGSRLRDVMAEIDWSGVPDGCWVSPQEIMRDRGLTAHARAFAVFAINLDRENGFDGIVRPEQLEGFRRRGSRRVESCLTELVRAGYLTLSRKP
jgi:hypothetical protein